MPFKFERKSIPDVVVVEKRSFEDERGFFEETYKESPFKEFGINRIFLQDNHSFSKKGVLRGLHFQRFPQAQGKLVSVISGKIFDVAVDLRPESKHLGKWVYEYLSADNHKMLWIPEGFAHGFVAMEDSHVIYKATNEFHQELDDGIIWNDTDLKIEWPLSKCIVSEKDLALGSFKDAMKRGVFK